MTAPFLEFITIQVLYFDTNGVQTTVFFVQMKSLYGRIYAQNRSQFLQTLFIFLRLNNKVLDRTEANVKLKIQPHGRRRP